MRWIKIEQNGEIPLARSSHSVTVVNNVAYLYGGENVPRTPIDSNLHAFDLKNGEWKMVTAVGSAPSPRVGHTAARVGDFVYIFGGRSGKPLAPLLSFFVAEAANCFKLQQQPPTSPTRSGYGTKEVGEGSLNDLHRFDTLSKAWSREPGGDSAPPVRSFHAMTSDGHRYIYLFGGCGQDGRLNDLWQYDTQQQRWEQMPSSKAIQARGGAGLAVSAHDALYVIAGFCGHEMDDVHRFDIQGKRWECPACCTRDKQGLPPRSVFGVAAHACAACSHSNHILLYGGEIDPSTQGHDGAGHFSNEVFCFDTSEGLGWHSLTPEGQKPIPRGWFAASDAGDGALLIHGGNSDTNERLSDMHLLQLH